MRCARLAAQHAPLVAAWPPLLHAEQLATVSLLAWPHAADAGKRLISSIPQPVQREVDFARPHGESFGRSSIKAGAGARSGNLHEVRKDVCLLFLHS
ncbi:hypothetical protein CBOM_08116 [Ceraceosorus bombacis]|uniref:Uncharacterized protein n=1 Tax=Ceraceosorus bombacis TaxID=401625 RepID=A0A0P1B759_9BASI|nr:hypothetical protein CBOM_08116 [Ceraceosorus bombacis]